MKVNADNTMRGNWVEYDGKYYQIDTIAEEFPTLNTIDFGIGVVTWDNINPIQLTKDILLKCGFEKEDETHLKKNVLSYGVIHAYMNRIEGKDLAIELGQRRGYTLGYCNCKSLPQLQNLYFALTGEELNVQL